MAPKQKSGFDKNPLFTYTVSMKNNKINQLYCANYQYKIQQGRTGQQLHYSKTA